MTDKAMYRNARHAAVLRAARGEKFGDHFPSGRLIDLLRIWKI